MELLKCIFMLSVTVLTVEPFQPNCDASNQFLFYCFPITYCDSYNCDKSDCGLFKSTTEIVRVGSTKIIPKCAFTNSDALRHILAENNTIKVVASGSFVNLSNVDIINLSFNVITQLHSDTFINVSATSLDLSWNKLVYIQEGAFRGLHNLRYLNLSKNELSTLPIHEIPFLLTELNLSSNLFDRILLTSRRTPSLTDIDLSHNSLKRIALSFDKPVQKIDLSQNLLSRLDFVDIPHCKELKISSNQFFSVPEPLTYLSVKKVSLYPNPWNCDELQYLWLQLQNNLVDVLDDTPDQTSSFPICVASEEARFKISSSLQRSVGDCENDENCDDDKICRNAKCLDPCKENACDPTSNCVTIKHRFHCMCQKNERRNPREPYSPCYEAECFLKEDCFSSVESRYCNMTERKCRTFSQGAGYGGSFAGGSGGGYSGSSSGSSSGGHGGGYGGSYASGSIGNPGGSFDGNQENEKWWIYEIPESSPTHKGTPVSS